MAGLGAKLFTAFSKLTAAQVNGYLMDQTIMRFASVAVRDAAFGGAGEPTLAEGMTCYLDDTNVLQSYNGSAWVTVANTDRPMGLVRVAESSFTGITSAAPLDLSNIFTSDYRNYRVVFSANTGATAALMTFRLRDSGGAVALTNYEQQQLEYYQTTVASSFTASKNAFEIAYNYGESKQTTLVVDIFAPNVAVETNIFYQASIRRVALAFNYVWHGSGNYNASTVMTGLRFFPSAGTAVGNISVYGYN
jgi:hypothetical protein